MTIFELATELGKAIREDERMIRMEKAKEAYESSEKIGNLMMEYGIQQQALAIEAGKEDHDDALMDQIQKRLDSLYTEICEDETFLALNAAQEAVNELMNQVNQTINYNITGEKPCTHDCSTCGGCH